MSKESIYDGHITLNEYPYLDVKEELSEQKTLITDVMSPKSGSIVTLNSQEIDVNLIIWLWQVRSCRVRESAFWLVDASCACQIVSIEPKITISQYVHTPNISVISCQSNAFLVNSCFQTLFKRKSKSIKTGIFKNFRQFFTPMGLISKFSLIFF